MYVNDRERLRKFQEFIGYEFKNEDLLLESLTTPQLGNEIRTRNYEFLETLGDAVIKVIFILKLYQRNINDPGEITKIKAGLEMNKALTKVADTMNLDEFIFKNEKQQIKGTRIMADVFEAICGAIFLDANYDLNVVQEKLINPFYADFNSKIESSILSKKNELLEFLQEKFKTSIIVELEYEKKGVEHEPIWIAKHPKILERDNQKELVKLPKRLKSAKFTNKKEADKDIYARILEFLKNKEKKEN